ncbi:hypothetical protein QAD02_024008 [Eretmocerus hayati]|uniref:Uncharacterized protein n=1 Tax=Eretmocerus hayati TaxID=131215 RepID=A0ACC2PZ30_9HYME|nr:hypothetical protein QAD02_024008 [Eretmocerus hayati]
MDLVCNRKRQKSLQLRKAVLRYDVGEAENLIETGADVNFVNPATKQSILDTAIRIGQKDMVTLLLHHGADPNPGKNSQSCKTILSSAVAIRSLHLTLDMFKTISEEDHTEILELLLNHGALSDSNRVSVFNAVLRFGSLATMSLFAKFGLDLDRCKVRFPLHEAAKNQCQEVLCKLLQSDYLFKIDELNESGSTALHLASSAGNGVSLRLLLESGADPNLLNRDGESALDIAIRGENYAEVEVLLNYNARTSKGCILMMADKSCNKKIVKSVLRRMILMEALGERLFNDEDERLLKKSEWIGGMYSVCKSELEIMRVYRVCGSISFYDVLLNNEIFSTPNRILINMLKESLISHVEEFFPHFLTTIEYRVSQIEHRYECINRARTSLEQILCLDSGTFHVIYSKIMSSLEWKDFYHLCRLNSKPYVSDVSL